MTSGQVPVWEVSRESVVWVGPISVLINGVAATSNVKFTLLPRYQRPVATDWLAPVVDPGGSGSWGVLAVPVPSAMDQGIWAQITDNPNIPVIEPDEIGWVRRT